MGRENPLHADWYADHALQHTVPIVENVQLARDTFRVRVACPAIASRITPGQFVMLRIAGVNDPLIGRPLAMYRVSGEAGWLDVVYLVKGKFTSQLARQNTGDLLEIWGPLGNGFLPQPTEHLIMVAGGIGQTPFLALAQESLGRQQFGDPPRLSSPAQKITFCYGARAADYFAGLEDFESLGIDLRLSTDDGSRGHHGLVTDLLKQVLKETTLSPRIVCCGPERMMEAVAHVAQEAGVPCEVSLETPMACGIGICFTCVAMIKDDQGECDYKRTCVEGPVFDAARIAW
jgi:dihydroorotate dehydrogenase electron transfer subunit